MQILMLTRLTLIAAILGTAMLSSTAPAQKLSADGAIQTFSFVSDQYFSDVYFHFAPTSAPRWAFISTTPSLEDYSAANHPEADRRPARLREEDRGHRPLRARRLRRRRPHHPAQQHPLAASLARGHPPLGEESRQLLLRHHQLHLRPHGAALRSRQHAPARRRRA